MIGSSLFDTTFTITGFTCDVESMDGLNINSIDDIRDMWKAFSGKNAGICYMKERYFNSYVTDRDKALKRFEVVADTGHHSIADHVKITVLIENASKMLAMLLNSLQDYSTSEKSGRYTNMSGSNSKENELYNKWSDILQGVIQSKYVDMSKSQVAKIAMENARYFLSVFTRSTTMSYTTSLRQWNYIFWWIKDFERRYLKRQDKQDSTFFELMLSDDLMSLKSFIYDNLFMKELRDNKGRSFRFLSYFVDDISMGYTTSIGDSYVMKYEDVSFAYLAQAQRHRTLKYFMLFDGKSTGKFYIPEIIRDDIVLLNEWVTDMKSVESFIPQGMLIPVVECGDIYDFTLKCKERLCGRAQIEIMRKCVSQLEDFYNHSDSLSSMSKDMVDRYIINGKVLSKGCILGGCTEPCYFGCKNFSSRCV